MSPLALIPILRQLVPRHGARILWCALLAAPLLAVPVRAGAQIAVVGNSVDEHEAGPGQRYVGSITVRNLTSEPQPVRIYQTDYNFKAAGTTDFGDAGSTPRSNATWVAPQTQRVTVPPRSEVTVPYTVKVPQNDSLRGTYWSAIMVEAAETAPGAGSAVAG